MNLKVLEVNEDVGSLRAIRYGLSWSIAYVIKVQINKSDNSVSSYTILIDIKSNAFVTNLFVILVFLFKTKLLKRNNSSYHLSYIKRTSHKSKITNEFVNQLISKSKNFDEKAQSKEDKYTDVGD